MRGTDWTGPRASFAAAALRLSSAGGPAACSLIAAQSPASKRRRLSRCPLEFSNRPVGITHLSAPENAACSLEAGTSGGSDPQAVKVRVLWEEVAGCIDPYDSALCVHFEPSENSLLSPGDKRMPLLERLKSLLEGPTHSVFLDANIFQHAAPRRPGAQTRTVNWGCEEFEVEEPAARPARPTGWLREEVKLLPEVARLARKGRIKLFTSIEAKGEQASIYASGISKMFGSPLSELDIEHVSYPMDAEFVAFGSGRNSNPEEFLNQFQDERLAEIRDALGEGKGLDPLHLYTAEEAGMDYFLTLDNKLLNSIRNPEPFPLGTKPVKPSELLKEL